MRNLGICWIVYGIFRLGMGVAGALLAPTATVMFGALLTRVADPFTWMGFFHVWYVCWIGLSFVCGILGIVGGLALTRSPNGGRGLLFAASFLSLSDLPVGIAMSVYTLIVLLRGSASAEMVQDRKVRSVRQDIS
jgi:MFS family permease